MNGALRRPMTLAAFLAWEDRQELRWEFDGVAPIAMNGGMLEHEQIGYRLRTALDLRLTGKPCRTFGPNMKVTTSTRSRYPDVGVSCTRQRRGTTVIEAPIALFEVVIPGTSRIDRIDKVRDYLSIPSVRRYGILEADSIAATVFLRDGEQWLTSTLVEGDTL